MDYNAIAGRISKWMEKQVAGSGSRGVVLGLSGGLDSVVVMALAVRAAGVEALAVIMPCRSLPEDEKYARLAAETFGADTLHLPLNDPYEAMLDSLPPAEAVLASANIKARLRMTTLYYVANVRNYLVAGTGNRSELATGYFTKYGDGGADMLPIGALLKTQVRELARVLGVPQEIIDKPPSAGLWRGQTDEEEMGIDYETLDEVLSALDDGRRPDAPEEAVKRVQAMMRGAQHKLNTPPVFNPHIS